MKNVLKARIAPLFGIIAMIAVIGFMTGCGEEEEPVAAVVGEVSIQKTIYGEYYTTKPLVAKYTGTEAIYYYWFELDGTTSTPTYPDFNTVRDTPLNNNNLVTAEYTPTTAGFYTVAVADKTAIDALVPGSNAIINVKWGGIVQVYTAPNWVEFCGKWQTTAEFNPAGSPAATRAHETIVINHEQFKLDSTYTPPAESGTPTAPDTTNEGPEHIYWTINTAVVTTASLPTGYSEGLVLNVTATSVRGYTAFTSFNVYKKADGSSFIMRRTNATGSVIERDYRRQ